MKRRIDVNLDERDQVLDGAFRECCEQVRHRISTPAGSFALATKLASLLRGECRNGFPVHQRQSGSGLIGVYSPSANSRLGCTSLAVKRRT
jgi:hypothetical protein